MMFTIQQQALSEQVVYGCDTTTSISLPNKDKIKKAGIVAPNLFRNMSPKFKRTV